MTIQSTNIFRPLPPASKDEVFDVLARGRDTIVERIVSHGQTTPAGSWLEQEKTEWDVLLRGRARIRFRDGESEIELNPGDAVTIPGGVQHRVTMTSTETPAVWLAVHFAD
jgi:cupin 2 domain-containing protein